MGPEIEKAIQVLNETEVSLVKQLLRLPLYIELLAVLDAKRRLMEPSAADQPKAITASNLLGVLPSPPAQPPRAPLVRRQIRSNSKSGVYRALAREIFEKTERRATAAAIVDLMQQRGLAVADRKKEAAAAASALSSYAEFDNTSDAKGAGYGLRSWSAPVGMNGTRTVIGSADSPHATPITERQATDFVMEPAA